MRDGIGEKTIVEDQLISQIANGDAKAFERLFCDTKKQVFSFVLSMVGNVSDAEDILQETYLKVYHFAGKYKPQGKAMSWIFKIAHNEVKMYFRKKGNHKTEDFDQLENVITFEQVSGLEDRLVLESAFRYIKEKDRTILMLHLVSGFKHREIAELMNCPLSTVLSKYNRALKQLKNEIERSESNERR